jgi:exopolysaccharide biosynthesis protein
MLIFAVLFGLIVQSINSDSAASWQSLAAGMDFQIIKIEKPTSAAKSQITVVRIDPKLWELVFICISQTGETSGKTAHEWCKSYKLTAAINAGMFDTNNKTHVGYLRYQENVNNGQVNNYKSVAAFDPKSDKELPQYKIFDLDIPGVTINSILKDYSSAVQNLRLIKKPATNVWNQQNRKWSEAAIGEDNAGRILFIFSRSPFSMHDLNEELLKSGIGIVAAQHVEGGPEAQLYLHVGNVELDLFGSYETSFKEDDGNTAPWPIPNIIGIRPKSSINNDQ